MTTIHHAASVTAAYLGNHTVTAEQIPSILASVYAAFRQLGQPPIEPATPLIPAVPVGRSVRPDGIICLDCGFTGQIIRRHLTSAHGLTVEKYRERWGLAPDYPVVAPNCSQKRSALATKIGLGRSPSPRQLYPHAERLVIRRLNVSRYGG